MGGGFSTIDGTASHAALTTTHGGILQTAAMKNVASGIAGLDASARIVLAQMQPRLPRGLLGTFAWADMTVVSGTWSERAWDSQTDYDDVFVSVPGEVWNWSAVANLDEFKVSNLVLNAGTYEIKVVSEKGASAGILEVLYGADSLGTSDLYAAASSYNFISTFSVSPTVRTSADLRFRVNGKNASGNNYSLPISRIQIRKTA